MFKRAKLLILVIMISLFGNKVSGNYEQIAYDFNFLDIDGNKISLSKYKGNVIIIVNVASECGFTKQYDDMQKIWEEYKEKKVIMIGVPSNDFGQQEPGSSSDIKNFCEAKFGITFQMMEKVRVKGDKAHPFYIWARKNYGGSAIPKWNFHKIIINKQGKIADTFSSITNPSSNKFRKSLDKIINLNF